MDDQLILKNRLKEIRLEKGIHTGLRRTDVLHRLEMDSIADNIQKVCLTTNYDASTTFYF